MKISVLILFIGIFSISAKTYAQETKISLEVENATINEVFEIIKARTSYSFWFDLNNVDINRKVSVKAEKETVKDILSSILKEQNLDIRVNGNHIVIVPKNTLPANSPMQEKKIITGTITDEKGESIIGANVIEKGTTNGIITDIDGKFTLHVQENAVLQISYIGYVAQEVAVRNQSNLTVKLLEDTKMLEEVVVVGYGTMKKSDLTGSVSKVTSDKLLDRPAVNISQALSGKAAGVEIFENGGDPSGKMRVRIRGDNSINSSNEPLYVVDGVIGVSNINLLNPSDIASIEVLKDASATAIYGARGANGVIMITTRRGLKTDKPEISYDGYLSFGTIAKKLDLMNAEEWWQTYNTTMDNAAKFDPAGYAAGKYKKATPESVPKLLDASGNPIYNTDWQDEAYRTAFSQNHQLGVRGGTDKIQYSASLGYMHKEALLKNTYLDIYNGRVNMDSQLRDWLKVGMNMAFNYNEGNNNYTNYQIKRLAQEGLPIIPVKYPDGTWGSNRDFPGAVQDTPSRYIEEMVNETGNTQIISDLYLDFRITKDLTFKSTFAIDFNNRKRNYYSGKELVQYSKTQGGIATIETVKQVYWQNENYFNWNKEFNADNRLNAMIGLSWQQRTEESVGATSQKFSDDFYQWHNLGAGAVMQPSSSGDWMWAINSYFARFNYTLFNKYMFTATGRYDGSSKFGQNNRYAFFPSFAFAWRVSEESFIKDIPFIYNLKLRSSVGETGNQEIGNYKFMQELGSQNVIFGDAYNSALYRQTFGNPDLRWEKTMQWDIGLDIGLFKQRVDLTADYYYKKTSDLLLNAPIPASSGLTSIMQNIGSVQNQGVELSLSTHNIKSADFNWTTTILFNINRNKVLQLGINDEDIFPGPAHTQGQFVILRVGEPVGSLWGLTRLGTWGTDEAAEAAKYGRLPGDVKYADLNMDYAINNDDNSIIGCTLPKWTGTLSNTFMYKGFDFTFDIRFMMGNKVVNASTHNSEDRSGVANGFKTNLDAWTPDNQHTMIAQRRPLNAYYDSYPDTYWMQDGSFIRGQNFVLGYNFSDAILKKINVGSMRVYVSAQNLFCITDYTGYDPEVTTREGDAFGQGIDDFSEPKARSYTFGLNVRF